MIAVDEAAGNHSDEDEEVTGSDDISGPQLDHDGELLLGEDAGPETDEPLAQGPDEDTEQLTNLRRLSPAA